MPEAAPNNIKMWNLARVIQQLGTEDKAIEFAEKKGLIPMNNICKVHKTRMSLEYTLDNPVGSFVCNIGPCGGKIKISRLDSTCLYQFESEKPSVALWCYLVHAWASEWSYEMTAKEYPLQEKSLSIETIKECYRLCGKNLVIFKSHLSNYCKGKIGGRRKVVWIDEINIAKKVIKGQPAANITVIAMLEEGSKDVRLEVCPEDTKSVDCVLPLVQRHVAKRSIVKTSLWQAYDGLHKQFVHKRLENISMDISNPHSECVETKHQWNDFKRALHRHNVDRTNRDELSAFIVEYSWRCAISRDKLDPFDDLINAWALLESDKNLINL